MSASTAKSESIEPSASKTIVLMRHATRSMQGLGDSNLNEMGLRQAERLASLQGKRGRLPEPTRLLASPKKRAIQTLTPLAQTLEIQLDIDARLDERHQNETAREFEVRVRAVLEDAVRAPNKCIYLCSHLDWLELALFLLPSNMSDTETASSWAAGELKIFRVTEDVWEYKGREIIPGEMT